MSARPHTWNRRRPRGRRILAALPLALVMLALGASSASAVCNTWAAAIDGNYLDNLKWSLGHYPTASEDVCITLSGTYTVTLSDNGVFPAAKSLTLGGATGTQTLRVKTALGVSTGLSITDPSTIGTQGRIQLDQDTTGAVAGQVAVAQVTAQGITNHGTILAQTEGPVDHRTQLSGPVTNAADGVVHVTSGELRVESFVNNGLVQVDPTGSLYMFGSGVGGNTFVNNGNVANNGDVLAYLQPWVQNSGSVTGNPIRIVGGGFTDSGGTGAFNLTNTVPVTGDIPPGQTVTVGGPASGATGTANFTAPGTTVAAGATLVLDVSATNSSQLLGARVTNNGTLRVIVRGPYAASISAPITNGPAGVVEFQGGAVRVENGATITNHGALSIDAATGLLMVNGGVDFTSDGTLSFGISGASTFGRITSAYGSTVGPLAGTINGVLTGGYAPAAGTAFKVIDSAFGGGAFGAVGGGFTADYGAGKFVSLVAAAPTAAAPTPAPAPIAKPIVKKKVRCVVPALKGKSLKAATRALKGAHCSLGQVRRPKRRSARRAARYVVAQSAKPGRRLSKGAAVSVTLGRK